MKVKTTVELPHDDLAWVKDEYPKFSVSALLTMLLHNFRTIHHDVGLTPQKAARDAAKELKAQFDEGMFEGLREED